MALRAKRFELIGMVLILVSAGWQVFIERPFTDAATSNRQYQLDRKFDTIWMVLADAHIHQFPDRSDTAMTTNVDVLIRDWDYATSTKYAYFEWLTKWVNLITAILFFSGSTFIIYGKWLETKEPPPQPIV